MTPSPAAPTLRGGGIVLRAHREEDIPLVLEQCQDPEMARWTTVPTPYTLGDAKEFVRHLAPDGWASDRDWHFAVEAEGCFAGGVGFRHLGSGRVEIGYAAHPWARGRGLMELALRTALHWAFEERDVQVVGWLAARGNWASRRLAWRLGFAIGDDRAWMDQRGVLVQAWHGSLARGEELAPRGPWLEAVRIVGERVVLRQLAERDLPRIVETLNDPLTQRWQEQPRVQAPHTVVTQADFVLARAEQAASGRNLHWAMADPDGDAYLGQMTLFGVTLGRSAALSYWTHPDARGRGLTQEAARLVVRHCFVPWADGGLGLHRVWADAEPDNAASRRVLARAGFVQTGVDRASAPKSGGGWADQVRYDVLAP